VAADGDGPMGPTRLRLSKPVLAAIEGPAVAGGLELALWCDLRVAAEGAVLGVLNRRFGVPLIDLGTIRLPRLVGHGRAMDLLLTGRPVGAAEALAMGLVDRVVPDGTALAAAVTLARELGRPAPGRAAQRPAVRHRAVGPDRAGGGGQRAPPRDGDPRLRRDGRPSGQLRRRSGPSRRRASTKSGIRNSVVFLSGQVWSWDSRLLWSGAVGRLSQFKGGAP
jgi:hypothetical protein